MDRQRSNNPGGRGSSSRHLLDDNDREYLGRMGPPPRPSAPRSQRQVVAGPSSTRDPRGSTQGIGAQRGYQSQPSRQPAPEDDQSYWPGFPGEYHDKNTLEAVRERASAARAKVLQAEEQAAMSEADGTRHDQKYEAAKAKYHEVKGSDQSRTLSLDEHWIDSGEMMSTADFLGERGSRNKAEFERLQHERIMGYPYPSPAEAQRETRDVRPTFDRGLTPTARDPESRRAVRPSDDRDRTPTARDRDPSHREGKKRAFGEDSSRDSAQRRRDHQVPGWR